MIAAAVAAMGAGVYAAGIPATGEEAYDFTATLKTTKGKLATAKAKSNACLYEGKAYFRTQATVKLQGLIWGCWCQTIGAPTAYTAPDADGYVFWNATDKAAYNDFASTAFGWTVLNRIESTAKKVEGLWTLDLFYLDADDNSVQEFALVGAGFGTAAGNVYDEDDNETTYISSISGQAVGQRFYTCVGDEVELGSFCKMGGATPYDFIWWELCDCADGALDTVAFGSWSIKWNGKVASAMAKKANILDAYKFPKYVAEAMAYVPAPAPEPSKVKKTYEEAKAALAVAQEAYDKAVADDAKYNDGPTAYYYVNGVSYWINTNGVAAVEAAGKAVKAEYEAVKVAFSNAVEELKALDTDANIQFTTNAYTKAGFEAEVTTLFTEVGKANALNIAAQAAFDAIATATNKAHKIELEQAYDAAKTAADVQNKKAADQEKTVNDMIAKLSSTTVQADVKAALAKCKETGLAKDQFGDPNAKALAAEEECVVAWDEAATKAGNDAGLALAAFANAQQDLKLAKMACDLAGEDCE